MLKRYPQLQSGFLSPTETFVTKPPVIAQTPSASLLTHQPKRQQQDLFYVQAIDDLLDKILNDPFLLRDLDFKEQLFSAVGKAFGNSNWANFVTIQGDNAAISSAHVLFMKETTELSLGRRASRSVENDILMNILSAANPPSGGFKPTAFFNSIGREHFRCGLEDFIVGWIANAGYTDFLFGLRVLFGRRGMNLFNTGIRS